MGKPEPNPTLDVWEFRDWIDEKPNVGRAGSRDSCPLARYAKEVLHLEGVSVGSDGIRYSNAGGGVLRAPWVSQFVKQVDSTGGSITSSTALRILDRI